MPAMWRVPRGFRTNDIDARLSAEVGGRLDGFHAHVRELPRYRFVDLDRSAEHYCKAIGTTVTIESDHRAEYLAAILHAAPSRWLSRRIRQSERVAWPVGPTDEAFLPVDTTLKGPSWASCSTRWTVFARMRMSASS